MRQMTAAEVEQQPQQPRPLDFDREGLLYMAQLAEQTERYDEMAKCMKEIARARVELTNEERNMLSIAYKNLIGSRRKSLRILLTIEQLEESEGNVVPAEKIKLYRVRKVEPELFNICQDILTTMDEYLIPNCQSLETKTFYLKMKGDYYRYMAEYTGGDKRKNATGKATLCYQTANEAATADLKPTNPVRLGLALNCSVFYFEVLEQPEKAIELATKAFEDAMVELDALGDQANKDSALIMQLIKDNLNLWTADLQQQENDQQVIKEQQEKGKQKE